MSDLLHACCFAGAGGTCTGFRAAGFRTVFAVEWERHRAATLRANHGHVQVVEDNIARVRPAAVAALLPYHGYRRRPIDVLTVSAPCESFSTSRGVALDVGDDRDLLVRHAIDLARAVAARVVLMENVPQVICKQVRVGRRWIHVLTLIRQWLEAAGYRVLWGLRPSEVLNAADYAIPQRRRRWFLVAVRDEVPLILPNRTTAGRPPTVREAFAGLSATPTKDLPQNNSYAAMLGSRLVWPLDRWHDLRRYHVAPVSKPEIVERLRFLSPGERLKDVTPKLDKGALQELREAGHVPPRSPIMRYSRLSWDTPSWTILSRCEDLYAHPTDDRFLSLAELMRLQAFPDGYRFTGNRREIGEQIGDAVPPYWAYQWAVAIRKMLITGTGGRGA